MGLEQCCLLSLNPPVEKKQHTDKIETTCDSQRPIGISKYSWKGHDSSNVDSEGEYSCVYLDDFKYCIIPGYLAYT